MSTTIPSARLVLLKDLKNCKKGDSIRVTGLWKTYCANTDTAVIQYDNYEAEIDTSNIDAILPIEGDTVQCIGEIVQAENSIRITARIIKIVNTLDLELYEKVVQLRNETLE